MLARASAGSGYRKAVHLRVLFPDPAALEPVMRRAVMQKCIATEVLYRRVQNGRSLVGVDGIQWTFATEAAGAEGYSFRLRERTELRYDTPGQERYTRSPLRKRAASVLS